MAKVQIYKISEDKGFHQRSRKRADRQRPHVFV